MPTPCWFSSWAWGVSTSSFTFDRSPLALVWLCYNKSDMDWPLATCSSPWSSQTRQSLDTLFLYGYWKNTVCNDEPTAHTIWFVPLICFEFGIPTSGAKWKQNSWTHAQQMTDSFDKFCLGVLHRDQPSFSTKRAFEHISSNPALVAGFSNSFCKLCVDTCHRLFVSSFGAFCRYSHFSIMKMCGIRKSRKGLERNQILYWQGPLRVPESSHSRSQWWPNSGCDNLEPETSTGKREKRMCPRVWFLLWSH